MKASKNSFIAVTDVTKRSFIKAAQVKTPKMELDFFTDRGVDFVNVTHWEQDFNCHSYIKLDQSVVDDKPLYFVEHRHQLTSELLLTKSFTKIGEAKAYLKTI